MSLYGPPGYRWADGTPLSSVERGAAASQVSLVLGAILRVLDAVYAPRKSGDRRWALRHAADDWRDAMGSLDRSLLVRRAEAEAT